MSSGEAAPVKQSRAGNFHVIGQPVGANENVTSDDNGSNFCDNQTNEKHNADKHQREAQNKLQQQPLIMITESAHSGVQSGGPTEAHTTWNSSRESSQIETQNMRSNDKQPQDEEEEEGQFEVVDGIRYKLVAAVTKPPQADKKKKRRSQQAKHAAAGSQNEPTSSNKFAASTGRHSCRHNYRPTEAILEHEDDHDCILADQQNLLNNNRKLQLQLARHSQNQTANSSIGSRLNTMRRKSTALMTNLINSSSGNQNEADPANGTSSFKPPRRLSIYEMTKSPPPETSLEIYLNERRRSSNISAKQVQQTLEQKSTFEVNYNQRQQYFKDLNAKLINQDKKLLNVVANRGQIHRHSVDIAQLPLSLALAKARGGVHQVASAAAAAIASASATSQVTAETNKIEAQAKDQTSQRPSIDQASGQLLQIGHSGSGKGRSSRNRLFSRRSISVFSHSHSHRSHKAREPRKIVRKFKKLNVSELTASPAPDVKIGQRVAYKEYYGNEFGTIRWIGRVPQISPDWTVGVEFDNAIGEGDGSLSGRRYFIAKECFAKFLPLDSIALVDQHVGRPEPGTMISVMSAASRPGQLISIQRVSTVHVQHCFLNAPHRRPGPEIPLLAVNTRLHCQCPNCGPCAHVIKPPRTQRLARPTKNATHMCQFSTYTCCGMQSQEETLCNYQGNKVTNGPVPRSMHNNRSGSPGIDLSSAALSPIGATWMAGSGYLSSLQAQQMKSMAQEYKLAPQSDHRRSSSDRQNCATPRKNKTLFALAEPTNNSYQAQPKILNGETIKQHDQARLMASSELADCKNESESDLMSKMTQAHIENSAYDATNNNINTQFSSLNLNQLEYESGQKRSSCSSDDRCCPMSPIEDEPIDSTLEADLERLSQARYGHSSRSRFKWSHERKSADARGNLLKSFKSLLSCLNMHANRFTTSAKTKNIANSFLSEPDNLPHWRYATHRNDVTTFQQEQIIAYDEGIWSNESMNHQNGFELASPNNAINPNLNNYEDNQPLSCSSDCGFSSGSQNSSPVKELQTNPRSSNANQTPVEHENVEMTSERELANRIYLNIAGKLIKSGVSGEAIEKLAKVLDEGQDSGQFDGHDQVIADIIGNVLNLLPNSKSINSEQGKPIESLN